MLFINPRVLIEGLPCHLEVPYPAVGGFYAKVLHNLDKHISNGYRFLAHDAITDYNESLATRNEHTFPLREALAHVFEVTIGCRFWPGEGVVFANLGITGETDITVNPVDSMTVILVIIVGIEVRRGCHYKVDTLIRYKVQIPTIRTVDSGSRFGYVFNLPETIYGIG